MGFFAPNRRGMRILSLRDQNHSPVEAPSTLKIKNDEEDNPLFVDVPQKVAGAGAGDNCTDGEESEVAGNRANVTVVKIHVPKSSAKVGERKKLGTNANRSRKLTQRSKSAGEQHDRQEKEN